MSKRNICYISSLLGLEKRGIESYSLGLLKNLKDINNNLEITLISGGFVNEGFVDRNYIFPLKPKVFKGLLGTNYINDHLAIFSISPSNIYAFICSVSLIPLLVKNKFDYYIPTNYFELVICKVGRFIKHEKSKIIFVGHAGPGHDDYKAIKLKPDIFVELTKPSFEWAKKNAPKSVFVELIPVGIDTNKFEYEKVSKAESPFKNTHKIALFIGAFVPYKRPELAIKLIESKKDLNLIMIGQGPLLEELKEKYEYLIDENRLFFTGSIDHSLIPAYEKLADISIMVSTDRENSPSVIMEAMTMKKPVIATKYDRTEWIIDDGGILVNPENINEFKNAVDLCFKNYNDLSQKAYKRSKYFSWISVSKMWNNLLLRNEK